MQIQKLILQEFNQLETVEVTPLNEVDQPKYKEVANTTAAPDSFMVLEKEQIESIKEIAFNEGRNKAMAEFAQQREQDEIVKNALLKLTEVVENAIEHNIAWRQKLLQASANLAYTIAKKLTYGTIAGDNETKIMKFLQEIMPIISEETKATIYISADLAPLQDKIAQAVNRASEKAEITCQLDEGAPAGECNVVLSGGELHFSQQEIQQNIDELFATYFAK